MFAFRCIACGEAFHQPLQPYASSDHSLRHKAWLHTWRGITESRFPGWLATRAGSLAHRLPITLVACLSIHLTYKACAAAFSPCSAITSTAAFGRLLASPESRTLYCYQSSRSLKCSLYAAEFTSSPRPHHRGVWLRGSLQPYKKNHCWRRPSPSSPFSYPLRLLDGISYIRLLK